MGFTSLPRKPKIQQNEAMSKRLSLTLLSAALLLAGCGSVPTPNTQLQTSEQSSLDATTSSNLQALYVSTSCKVFSRGLFGSSCSNTQRNAVEVAGGIYYRAGKLNNLQTQDFNSATVGAALVNGIWEISAYDGSTERAKEGFRKAVAEKGRGYHWNEPYGGLHAEQMLYRANKNVKLEIGISNFYGPCPTCRNEVATTTSNIIAWYPDWLWAYNKPR